MMVAAHPDDLEAAKALGLATAYVSRPLEFGMDRTSEVAQDLLFDIISNDFNDLADKLGL